MNSSSLFTTQKTTVIQSEKDLTAYESLRRDLDIQKAMYQEISKRLAETTITTALGTNNVSIVEEALAGLPASSGAIKYLLIRLDLQPRMWGRPRCVRRGAR